VALIRGLRVALLLALATLVGGILLSLIGNVRMGPRASAAEPTVLPGTAGGVAQQASNVELVRTRRGSTTLRLKAGQSTTYTNGRVELSAAVFRLFAPDGAETLVEAPSAELLSRAEEGASGAVSGRRGDLGSWLLTGGVTIDAVNGLTLATRTLNYDESLGLARSADPVSFTRETATGSSLGMIYEVAPQLVHFPAKVQASMPLGGMGVVKIEAAAADHDLAGGTFVMRDYRALTQRGETLSGSKLTAVFREGSGIARLEGDEGFRLESAHSVTTANAASPLSKLLAMEGTRTMQGQRLAMVFDERQEPTSMEVSGDAMLSASHVNETGGPASIAAQTLQFEIKDGNLSGARAVGGVDLRGAPAEGEATGFRLKSEDLQAAFDPNLGVLQNLEGTGQIQLSDRDLESQGSTTHLDPNTNIVTLTGKEGKPATATWLGRRIEAQRIEADRGAKTLSARDGVRASYLPEPPKTGETPARSGSLPFFRGGETLYAMAGSLTFADQGKVAHYRDQVRLWQGDNRIEASEVDLNESAGLLEARTDVISTFRQPPPADKTAATAVPDPNTPPRSPSDDIVTVSAAAMKYDRNAGTILYTGRVQVTQGSTRVTGDTMMVTLDSEGRSAEKMETLGNVELRDRGRVGHGDKLVADLKANTMKLTGSGREATVQDETGQQVVRGSALTMDKTGDRILVESEMGGRTWITLKPRQGQPSQKGALAGGSDTHH